jgi:hypothetical protein
MRGQFERRLARIESRSGRSWLCAFSDQESLAINEVFHKYLGRDPTREDIRTRAGVHHLLTDEDRGVIDDAIRAAVRRGSALTSR